jgi:DNA-binding PadR family transcriptional regulator
MTPAVFAHGHLRLYLLSLLAERPMHGYDLIQALGSRFGGTYTPSAGTIYPRLAKLEDEGLVVKQVDGRKTIYSITDAGRAELAAREPELAQVEDDMSDSVRRLADEVRSSVQDAMKTLRADLAAAARGARDESRSTGRTVHTDAASEHSAARAQLQQAELALVEFRSRMRADLRGATHLSAATVSLLTDRLAAVRAEVLESVRAEQ